MISKITENLKAIQIGLGVLCTLGAICGGIYKFAYDRGVESGTLSCQEKIKACTQTSNQGTEWMMSGQCIEIIKGLIKE